MLYNLENIINVKCVVLQTPGDTNGEQAHTKHYPIEYLARDIDFVYFACPCSRVLRAAAGGSDKRKQKNNKQTEK